MCFSVLRSFSESRNHSCKEFQGLPAPFRHWRSLTLMFSRFWLMTAVWTVLVETIAANKSEACPTSWDSWDLLNGLWPLLILFEPFWTQKQVKMTQNRAKMGHFWGWFWTIFGSNRGHLGIILGRFGVVLSFWPHFSAFLVRFWPFWAVFWVF